MRLIFAVFSILFLTLKSTFGFSFFADANEVEEAKKRLSRQIEILDLIESDVERPFLPRLYFLKSSAKNVLDSIEKNSLGNSKTFQEFQKHAVAFQFSVSFFNQIETPRQSEALKELWDLHLKIVATHGLDENLYSQITLSAFTQMEKLLEQVASLSVADEIKNGLLENLGPARSAVGIAIGVARGKGGDRRTVYEPAEKAYEAVKKLYPIFEQFSAGDSGFAITLEIRGLNEFYAQFAEFSEKKSM